MPRFDDLTVFVAAADHGSLSAAARALDLSPAVASAAIKRLESELSCRLLARTTRSLRLSPDGERYLGFARRALEELHSGLAAIESGKQAISGHLTLSVPSDLGRHRLAGLLDTFQTTHPDISLTIRLSDQRTDLLRQPVDLAIRYGQPEDSSLVALPLAVHNRRVLCASPDYLVRHPAPQQPDDLLRHNCLRFALSEVTHSEWLFERDGTTSRVTVQGDRISDDGELVRRWAIAGKGLAYKSRLDIQADLQAGRLVELLGGYQGESAPLYLLCPHRRMLTPAIEALRKVLQNALAP